MACWRQCGSFATKLSRLNACENRMVVCWCKTQASSHNLQGVVDGNVNEVGISIVELEGAMTLWLSGPELRWLL